MLVLVRSLVVFPAVEAGRLCPGGGFKHGGEMEVERDAGDLSVGLLVGAYDHRGDEEDLVKEDIRGREIAPCRGGFLPRGKTVLDGATEQVAYDHADFLVLMVSSS